jgi:hypothetical protein
MPYREPIHAALINIGDSTGLVGLLVLVLVVGFVVWLCIYLLDAFGKPVISDPFYKLARVLIFAIAAVVVVDKALEVIFGVSLI